MPRLSIIIPHRGDDVRLETTLLSVLENRPTDCEVIVAHDGSYANPYQLDDEVLFVESEKTSRDLELLNVAIRAACSPVVNTILDGMLVQPDWTQTALNWLDDDPELATVAVGISRGRRSKSFGIDRASMNSAELMRRGRVQRTTPCRESGGAELACGFYRRKLLLALQGFDARLDLKSADLDLALALNALRCHSVCDSATIVRDAMNTVDSNRVVQQRAQCAINYGLCHGGLQQAAKDLAKDCLVGRFRTGWAWATGLLATPDPRIRERLDGALEQLADATESERLKLYVGESHLQRRAA